MDSRGHHSVKASKKKKNRTSSGAVKEVSPQVANGDGYEIKSIGIDFSSDCVSLNKESRRESVVTHDELDVAAIVISGGNIEFIESGDTKFCIPNRYQSLHRAHQEVMLPLERVTSNDASNVDFVDSSPVTNNEPIIEQAAVKGYSDVLVNSPAGQQEMNTMQQIQSCHQAADGTQLPGNHQPIPPCMLKAHRDLQRQISSLTRLQPLGACQASSAKALIHSAFDKLRAALNCRESELVTAVDEYIEKTNGTLGDRLYMAHVLKSFVDGAHRMTFSQQEDLRAHIKKYVAERGVDHTLGSAERFTCNIEDMVHHIRTFGLVESFSAVYSYTISDLPINAEGKYHFAACENTDRDAERQNGETSKFSKLVEERDPNLTCVSCAPDVDLLLGNVQHSNGQSAERGVVLNRAKNTDSGVDNCAIFAVPSGGDSKRSLTNSQLRSTKYRAFSRAASTENVDESETNCSNSAGCKFGTNAGADDLVSDPTISVNTVDMPEINNGLQTLNDDILAAKTDIAKLREDFCKIVYQDDVTPATLEEKCIKFDPPRSVDEDDTMNQVALQVGRLNNAALGTRLEAAHQNDVRSSRGVIRLPSAEANLFSTTNSYRCDYRGRGWRGSIGASMSVGRRYSGPSGYGSGSHHEQRDNHRYGGGDRGGYHSYPDGKSHGGHTHHTSQPSRRSVSYTADSLVDEDGFILVTRGRHDSSGGHGRGGGRVRGSSGDSLSSKCYYGSDSTYHGNRDGHKTHRGFYHGNQGNLGAKRWN